MFRRLLPLLLLVLPAGCAFSYHAPIQQGNALPYRTLARLHRGMTEAQVLYLLGSPVLADPPHPHRWLYVYYSKAGQGARPVLRRLTIVFRHGHAATIRGVHGAAALRLEKPAKGE